LALMNRPHVTLKLATSLDGRIATASGESRWISGPESRAEVQRMRAQADAVMIGAGTARADNPKLLAQTKPPPRRQPMRVVLDTHLSLPLEGKLIASVKEAELVVIGAEGADPARRAALVAAGASVGLTPRAQGGVNIAIALDMLSQAGVETLLVEGGGVLAANLIAEGAIDRLEWFRAPIILGAEGRPAVAALALARLAEAPTWHRVALRELGPDLWESYERA
jgi:diaminohydroxyphosphoribosylaminopyrimidine deaminase/5-amino-6-(5-phosphoribosylamino)uracil reductase